MARTISPAGDAVGVTVADGDAVDGLTGDCGLGEAEGGMAPVQAVASIVAMTRTLA